MNQGVGVGVDRGARRFFCSDSLSVKAPHGARWYAVYTAPRHEKSAFEQLRLREVEAFLPVYEKASIWKNRQRVMVTLPLFPGYLFVRIASRERGKVLGAPGVLTIVGNSKEAIPVPDQVVDFLRSDAYRDRVEPYGGLLVGQRVRIKSGPMLGLVGTLVRGKSSFRFVVSVEFINQHAALEIDADLLEPILS